MTSQNYDKVNIFNVLIITFLLIGIKNDFKLSALFPYVLEMGFHMKT